MKESIPLHVKRDSEGYHLVTDGYRDAGAITFDVVGAGCGEPVHENKRDMRGAMRVAPRRVVCHLPKARRGGNVGDCMKATESGRVS